MLSSSIPSDVKKYLRSHFSRCNRGVSSTLSLSPAIYEESLDADLINYWSRHQNPVKLDSGWIIKIDAHFLGGGRHWGNWEVADIGIVIIFRRKGKLVRSKMAFLQSKKLYASPLGKRDLQAHYRSAGMGKLLEDYRTYSEIIEPKVLSFTEKSKYLAFKKQDEQQQAMDAFQRRYCMKLYYLFYNPVKVPHAISVPALTSPKLGRNIIGCRIVPKDSLDKALEQYEAPYAPSLGDLKYLLGGDFLHSQHDAGWRLEHFIVDLMLECKEGVIDDSPNYESLKAFMSQKRMPMSASISITVDSADSEFDLLFS